MTAIPSDAESWAPLWPSITEVWLPNEDRGEVAHLINISDRFYRITLAFGEDRPARCEAVHPASGNVLCALWLHHDGPHVAASREYLAEHRFVIAGMCSTDLCHEMAQR